jgi:hypothetical protein
MQDEQTGSWWQQVTGRAILGPLKGKQLELCPWDEVSFERWSHEHPDTQVLQAEAEFQARYAPADWASRIGRLPVVTAVDPRDPLAPRDLVVGLEVDGQSRACPMQALQQQSPVNDVLGQVPVLIVLDADGRGVRCFRRESAGRPVDFYRTPGDGPVHLLDAESGSTWDYSGTAVAGPRKGQVLQRLQGVKDYWFDWKQHHPDTTVYTAGRLGRRP